MITVNLTGNTKFVTNTFRDNPYYGIATGNTECYYGFNMQSQDSLRIVEFLLKDISPSPSVYNLFEISGSTVNMNPAGMWEYIIYPVTGNTINDIDYSCTLENGLIKVIK